MKYIEKQVKKLGRLYESKYANEYIIEKLKKEIDKGVGPLDYKTNVKCQMTTFQYFMNNKYFLQFLKNISSELEKEITDRLQVSLRLKNVWGLKMKGKQDHVIEHNHDHSTNCISGILYLTNDGPGTFFPELNYRVKEVRGKFVLFSSFLLHSVKKSLLKKDRYTISFNFEDYTNWK